MEDAACQDHECDASCLRPTQVPLQVLGTAAEYTSLMYHARTHVGVSFGGSKKTILKKDIVLTE